MFRKISIGRWYQNVHLTAFCADNGAVDGVFAQIKLTPVSFLNRQRRDTASYLALNALTVDKLDHGDAVTHDHCTFFTIIHSYRIDLADHLNGRVLTLVNVNRLSHVGFVEIKLGAILKLHNPFFPLQSTDRRLGRSNFNGGCRGGMRRGGMRLERLRSGGRSVSGRLHLQVGVLVRLHVGCDLFQPFGYVRTLI